jgi:quinol monooxygenase YgiN
MYMTTTHRPELTPVLRPNGRPMTADAGATAQGKPCQIKKCGACGDYVVFVQSAKTGKWYLVNTYRYGGDNEAYYYQKNSPHFTTCANRVKANETLDAEINEERKMQRRAAALKAFMEETQAAGIEMTREMYSAKIAEYDAQNN